MNKEEVRDVFRKAMDCMDYVERLKQYHDCNDCIAKDCPYKPPLGEMVRINCFAWCG